MGLVKDNQEQKRVIKEKLSNTNMSSVLKLLALGTFEKGDFKNQSIFPEKNAQNIRLYKDLAMPLLKEKNNSNIKKHDLKSFSVLKQLAGEGPMFYPKNKKLNDQTKKGLLNSIGHKSSGCLKTEHIEDIFCKNRALLGVAKSLSSMETCEEDTKYLKQYLDILKANETPAPTNQEKKKNKDINNKIKGTIAVEDETILENIFAVAYRCQIKDNCKKWQSYLSVQDKRKVKDNYILENQDEQSFDESTEDEYRKEYYNFQIEKTIDVNFGEEMVPKSAEQDNYSFMKWIPVDQGNSWPSNSNFSISNHLVSIDSPRELDIGNQSATAVQSYYHTKFSSYYQHCSISLWQTGLGFPSVQSFDAWFFTSWQNQLAAVRNFVQKNIYFNEMNRYQNK